MQSVSQCADQFVWLGHLACHTNQDQLEAAIHVMHAVTSTPQALGAVFPGSNPLWRG